MVTPITDGAPETGIFGVGTAAIVFVLVGVGVFVGPFVGPGVPVGVFVDVFTGGGGVPVGVLVGVFVGVFVGTGVPVGVSVGVLVGMGVSVGVTSGGKVGVGVPVSVGVGVSSGVLVGVRRRSGNESVHSGTTACDGGRVTGWRLVICRLVTKTIIPMPRVMRTVMIKYQYVFRNFIVLMPCPIQAKNF